MKKLMLFILLIVGCDEETEPVITGWACKVKTDCFSIFDNAITDCPIPTDEKFETIDTTTVYSSIEECDSSCPSLPLTFYCKETN